MNSTQCPAQEKLDQFLAGELGEEESSSVITHVDHCSSCQTTLDLLTSDPLVEGTKASGESSGVVLNSLIKRLKKDSSPFDTSGHVPGLPRPAKPKDHSGERLGDLELIKLIGWGGSGAVYRARDIKLDRIVAVKILRGYLLTDPDAVARMEREAKKIAANSHENILSVFGFYPARETGQIRAPYLVTEFVDGYSLEEKIESSGALNIRWTARTVTAIARGLALAHEKGTIHRDIKPSNVLVNAKSGKPQLADFGLAIDENFDSKITQQGYVAGTPAYMSPEQVDEHGAIDRRTDIYSLGVVLFECLTGEVPFRGLGRATISRVLTEQPRDPRQRNSQIPKDLSSICLKAMSKDADRRYQQASEFADDLERWQQGKPTIARPVSRLEKLVFWVRQNKLNAALSAAVLSLLILFAVGSTIAAFYLANANKQTKTALSNEKRQAYAAGRQRDALMDTVQRLVFKVNDSLEKEIVDQDLLQKELLRISLKGLNSAALVSESEETEANTAKILLRLASVSYRLDESEESIQYVNDAVAIAKRLQEGESADDLSLKRLEARCNWLLGSIQIDLEDAQVVIATFDRAEKQTKPIWNSLQSDYDFLDEVALSRIDAVGFFVQQGDLETAFEHVKSCLKIADILEDGSEDTDEATESFVDPLFAASQIRAQAYEWAGDICYRQGKLEETAEYDYLFHDIVRSSRPYSVFFENDEDSLLDYWYEELDIIKSNPGIGSGLFQDVQLIEIVACIHFDEGDYESGMSELLRAIRRLESILIDEKFSKDQSVFRRLVDDKVFLAGKLLDIGRREQAERHAEEALETIGEMDLKRELNNRWLQRIHFELGQYGLESVASD